MDIQTCFLLNRTPWMNTTCRPVAAESDIKCRSANRATPPLKPIKGEQQRPTSKVAASPAVLLNESQGLNGFSTFTEPYRCPSERSSE